MLVCMLALNAYTETSLTSASLEQDPVSPIACGPAFPGKEGVLKLCHLRKVIFRIHKRPVTLICGEQIVTQSSTSTTYSWS